MVSKRKMFSFIKYGIKLGIHTGFSTKTSALIKVDKIQSLISFLRKGNIN